VPKFLNLSAVLHSLILLLSFSITLNTALSYSIMVLIIIFSIANRQSQISLIQLRQNPLALSFLLLFALHLVGLIWTDDINAGLKILSKQKIYLFAILLLVILTRENARQALHTSIAAIIFTALYSLYLHYLSPVPMAGADLSAFMHHMHYSLILCFTFGYLISQLDLEALYKPSNLALIGFALIILLTLFINAGRIGQIALPLVLMILAVGKFKLPFFKSSLLVLVQIALIFGLAYNYSAEFNSRADHAWYEINETIGQDKRDSISCRFEMWGHSIKLGSQQPLIGIGTGDSIQEMRSLLGGQKELDKLYQECGLGIKYQMNPHNNFILIYMQFGLLGLAVLLGVLFLQFRMAISTNSLPLLLLTSVTTIGMTTTSLISMHVKYMFFYAILGALLTIIHTGNKVEA